MRVVVDLSAADRAVAARYRSSICAGERVDKGEHQHVLAVRSTGAAFNAGISTQRKINIEGASAAVCLARGDAQERGAEIDAADPTVCRIGDEETVVGDGQVERQVNLR